MSQSRPPCPSQPTDRAHKAAKRYIYAWGDGTAEGNGTMKDLLGGKGAGLAEMTLAGLPTPPGFTITTEACNDYFAAGKQLPGRPVGRRPRARCRRSSARSGKGFGDAEEPAARLASAPGAKFSMPGMMDTVLNLGLNEETLAGPDRPDRQRALRLGRLPPVHPDVRPDRHGRERRSASTSRSRQRKHAHGTDAKDTDLDVADLKALVDEYKAVVKADTGRDFPTDPLRAAGPRDQGRLRLVVRQARQRLPQQPEDRPRPRHRRQRRDDGLRQHGRRLRHRRRVHPQPVRRRPRSCTASTSTTPRARTWSPASGRRSRSASSRTTCPRLRRVPAHRQPARGALPRRPGPRVHDRARQAVHAPDARSRSGPPRRP